MRRQAEPWETMVLLESLKERWVVSCNGRSQGGKRSLTGNKYGVPGITISLWRPFCALEVRALLKKSSGLHGREQARPTARSG